LNRRLESTGAAAVLLLWSAFAPAQSLAVREPLGDATGQALFDSEGAEGGLRAGTFDVRAAAGVAYGFDDNVYASNQAVRSDSLVTAALLLRATDQTPSRLLQTVAHLDARRYAHESSQDADQYGAAVDFGRAFGGHDQLGLRIDAAHQVESRTDIEAPLVISPYEDLRGALEFGHVFNRLSAELRAEGVRLQYDAPGQAYRDRWQYRAELAPVYAVNASLRALTILYFNRDDFDTRGALDASADTRGALLGARYESSGVFTLEAAAGYFQRRADDGIDDLDGLAVRASFNWQPTLLTHLEAGVLRTDAPTRLPGALAKIRSDVHVALTHAWSRNLALLAGLRYQQDEFDSLDRTDSAWFVDTGCSWSLTRRMLIDLRYQFAMRDAQDGVRDFDRQIARLSWVWRL
jgi:hypothetical protein